MGINARKALDKKVAQHFSQIISDKLIANPAYSRAKTILSYQSYAGEVNPSYFNEQALHEGKVLSFPICYENGLMVAAVPNTPNDWETGKYGIKAPVASRSCIIDPEDIDLVVVPCTAFSAQKKMRVGWGAGYYDRYLPRCKNAIRIAIAYEVQHIYNLCSDKWDVPLDAVVTEANIY